METVILVLHVLAAIAICGLVLLQHGKGADVGAAFGTGSAGSVFGSAGSANFLSRATAILALVFFLTSLGLTYFSTRKGDTRGVMSEHPATQQKTGQNPLEVPGQTPPGRSEANPLPPSSPAAPAAAPVEGRAQEVPK